jgi:tetratricopeptide (TPR) repeat protein
MRSLLVLAFSILLLAFARPAAADGYDHARAGADAEGKGRYEEALSRYTKAIDSGDLNNAALAQVHYRRGALRAYFGQTHAAIEDLTIAIERQPGLGEAHSMRGYLRGALGEDAAAELDHKAAIDQAPDDGRGRYLAWALQHHADLRRRQRRFGEALAIIDRALAAHDYADAYFRRAWIHLDMGRLDDARADYRRFLETAARDRRSPNNDYWPDEREAVGRLKVLSELK